ncbi:MAG: two-component regulator propeller domain-containing protein, partial [Candidatus Anammoxibacter sp.]
MKHLTLLLLLMFCTIPNLVDCGNASGATTKFRTQSTYKDVSGGDLNNVALYHNGNIVLAPKTEDISGINASYVWCMSKDRYGNIFAGTGNPGIVYKITEKKKAVEILRLPEGMHVQSMVIDDNGNIYVGTSPKGIIYEINNEMETKVFRDLPETYIWDLIVDSEGNLY